MPPQVRFSREDILNAAFALVRDQGATALNARALAQRLGCSTQPIYRECAGMDEIRQEVAKRAYALFLQRLYAGVPDAKTPYLSSGLSYLRFAHEEKELFKLLFMCDRTGLDFSAQEPDPSMRYGAKLVSERFGLSMQEALRFHEHIFIFTHGLASMIATCYIPYDEPSLIAHLSDELRAFLTLYGKTL